MKYILACLLCLTGVSASAFTPLPFKVSASYYNANHMEVFTGFDSQYTNRSANTEGDYCISLHLKDKHITATVEYKGTQICQHKVEDSAIPFNNLLQCGDGALSVKRG